MNQLGTILITTDFSETASQAFPTVKTLAEKFEAKILLVYVEEDRLPPFAGEFPGIQGIPINEILESHRARAREELKRVVDEHFTGHDVETVIATGTPHREIVRLAEERETDLIVMATHGRGFIAHALMGSTTERVIRHAPCPVLAVRERRTRS